MNTHWQLTATGIRRPADVPFTDHIEMAGHQLAAIVTYGVAQDGSIILTAAAPDRPTGNPLHSRFILDGTRITVDGTDVVCLRKSQGKLDLWSPHPVSVKEETL